MCVWGGGDCEYVCKGMCGCVNVFGGAVCVGNVGVRACMCGWVSGSGCKCTGVHVWACSIHT